MDQTQVVIVIEASGELEMWHESDHIEAFTSSSKMVVSPLDGGRRAAGGRLRIQANAEVDIDIDANWENG